MIKAVVSDIGGVFELEPLGRDPTARFPETIADWERRLHLPPGELHARRKAMNRFFDTSGKDGELGTLSQAEWQAGLRQFIGLTPAQLEAFVEDFWKTYLGDPNPELVAYFRLLRPRYRTALLSNSFDGAREREQDRYHFADMVDFIIYSHEVGLAKPDPRIYALTSQRLGVQPHEIVFLDDAERNVAAAEASGFHTILYQILPRPSLRSSAACRRCNGPCHSLMFGRDARRHWPNDSLMIINTWVRFSETFTEKGVRHIETQQNSFAT